MDILPYIVNYLIQLKINNPRKLRKLKRLGYKPKPATRSTLAKEIIIYKILQGRLAKIYKIARESITTNYQTWKTEFKDDFNLDIDELKKKIQELYPNIDINDPNLDIDRKLENLVRELADEFDKRTFANITIGYATFGKPIEYALKKLRTNVYLYFNNLGTQFQERLIESITQAATQSLSSNYIRGEISKIYQISKRRARLIARDQLGTVNSDIEKGGLEQAGLDFYTWGTAMDERVRGTPGGKYPKARYSHYLMEKGGYLFKNDNPTVYSSNKGKTWQKKKGRMEPLAPGMAIQCRCHREADFTSVLGEAFSEFEKYF